MRGFRPTVALTVVGTVVALLLPPGVVCFALVNEAPTACPMVALLMEQAALCHGEMPETMGTAEERCCCSMQRSTPPSLPTAPDAVSDRASVGFDVLAAVIEASTLLAPKVQSRRLSPSRVPAPPPPVDLFLHHGAFLL